MDWTPAFAGVTAKIVGFCFCLFPLAFAQSSELRLEFVPGNPASWQRFVFADRMAGSVFTGLGLHVEPLAPSAKELEQLPNERKEELGAHLEIYKKSPALYRRFLQVLALAPSHISWQEGATLAGLSPEDLAKSLEGEALEKILAAARAVSDQGPGLFLDKVEIAWESQLMAMAGQVNKNLPAGEQVPGIKEIAKVPRPKVEVIVINPGQVASWAKIEAKALAHLKNMPWDAEFQTLDSAQSQAKPLLKEAEGSFLPMVLFRAKDEAGRKMLDDFAAKGALEKKGKKQDLYLAEGFASSGVLLDQKETNGKNLQLFIMSQCPYGVAAQKALLHLEEEKKMPSGIKISYHYIVDKTEDKDGKAAFRSLHGTGELEENVRQMVLQKHQPEKLRCYLANRLADVQSSMWHQALESCGVNLEEFKKLYQDNETPLLNADAALTESFNIRSSPTFLWRGRYVLGGLASLANLEEFKGVDLKNASEANLPAGKCQ